MINKYIVLLVLSMALSSLAQQMKMKDVTMPLYNEERQLEYILRAVKMHVSKQESELYTLQIKGTGREQILITSP